MGIGAVQKIDSKGIDRILTIMVPRISTPMKRPIRRKTFISLAAIHSNANIDVFLFYGSGIDACNT